MDARRSKAKRSANNKVLVADQTLSQTLDKTLSTLQKTHEILEIADTGGEEENNSLDLMPRNFRDKMLRTATKIIQRSRPASDDKVNEAVRLRVCKLFNILEPVGISHPIKEELERQMRLDLEGASVAEDADSNITASEFFL